MTNTYRSGLMQAKCLGALPSGTTPPPALRCAALRSVRPSQWPKE
jgi:hypothetical protein